MRLNIKVNPVPTAQYSLSEGDELIIEKDGVEVGVLTAKSTGIEYNKKVWSRVKEV